jgi:hypothetical protein
MRLACCRSLAIGSKGGYEFTWVGARSEHEHKHETRAGRRLLTCTVLVLAGVE